MRTDASDRQCQDQAMQQQQLGRETEQLTHATYDNTPEFALNGTFTCKIVRVYDGDTVWAAIGVTVEEGVVRVRRICCRLAGIDTPEMPRSYDPSETAAARDAYAARNRAAELLTGVNAPTFFATDAELQHAIDANNTRVLRDALHLQETGKYGRHLARITLPDGRDLAEVLLAEGLARPYQ